MYIVCDNILSLTIYANGCQMTASWLVEGSKMFNKRAVCVEQNRECQEAVQKNILIVDYETVFMNTNLNNNKPK